MRHGLFGGTFDPPHLGHYLAASDAHEALALDRLMFIPAGIQPLKADNAAATPRQRLRMVELMVEDDDRFDVSAIEIERSGPSYTIETLRYFNAEAPSVERFLIVGADVLATLPAWRDPQGIAKLAQIVVLNRDAEPAGSVVATTALPTRRIDISSTEIRERVRCGRSIKGFVHPAVAEYIAAERLYQ